VALLALDDVRVSYGDLVAVDGVSFGVEENEVFVLLGANGAGKTSLLRCISGLLAAQTGSITFAGRPLSGLKPHEVARIGVSHVPEGRRVFTTQNVRQNLVVSHISRRAETLGDALDRVFQLFPRLKERQRQSAGTLSGGEQQMLAIGRALMNGPFLLMLDEPSLGLSPLMAELVFERLGDIARQGTSLLLVEQNAAALELATRGLVLANGREAFQGDARTLANSDYVRKAYLGI